MAGQAFETSSLSQIFPISILNPKYTKLHCCIAHLALYMITHTFGLMNRGAASLQFGMTEPLAHLIHIITTPYINLIYSIPVEPRFTVLLEVVNRGAR